MTVDTMMEEFHGLEPEAQMELACRIWEAIKDSEEASLWEDAEFEPDPGPGESDGDPHDVLAHLVGRVRDARRVLDARFRASAEPKPVPKADSGKSSIISASRHRARRM